MTCHSSATVRSETPHLNSTIKRRAESLINNKSIDGTTRTVLRYALEIDDPLLADFVRRMDGGESIIDDQGFLQIDEEKSAEEKISILADLICRCDEPGTRSAALLVLMATLEDATHPKALANIVKHFAFNRCGELNHCGMVEAQTAAFANNLFECNGKSD